MNVKLSLLTKVKGIFGVPSCLNPPRLTVSPLSLVKKLITVRDEYPVPLTVIVPALWMAELTLICGPIGTDTAWLLRLNCPSAPLLITTKEPGPVSGALGPLDGSVKLTESAVSPGSPGFRKNGPTLPPAQAQNRLIATPLVVSKPVPPNVTTLPCNTTVATLLVAKSGSLLVGSRPIPSIVRIVGMPAAAEPCNSA